MHFKLCETKQTELAGVIPECITLSIWPVWLGVGEAELKHGAAAQ